MKEIKRKRALTKSGKQIQAKAQKKWKQSGKTAAAQAAAAKDAKYLELVSRKC